MPEQTHYRLYAIGAVVRLCDLCHKAASLSDPESAGPAYSALQEMAIDHRNAVAAIDAELFSILERATGPIWGELPENLREICRKAGMEN